MNKISLLTASFLFSMAVSHTLNAQLLNPAPYCELNLSNQTGFMISPPGSSTTGDGITNVTLGALNNNSNGYIYHQGSVQDSTYLYYNSITTPTLSVGNNYQVSVTFGAANNIEPMYYAVWIDFNKNNNFDANELIMNNSNSGGQLIMNGQPGTRTIQFTVPLTSAPGITRMRVARTGRKNVSFSGPNYYQANYTHPPCFSLAERTAGINPYGEVEDYNVLIVPNTSSNVSPALTILAADSVKPFSALLKGTVNANNNVVGLLFEYGLTASYGATVVANPVSATGANTVQATAKVLSLIPNEVYHARLVGKINASSVFYSSDITFTTTANSVAVPELEEKDNFLSVYPNPGYDCFTLNLEGFKTKEMSSNVLISILGLQGESLYEERSDASLLKINVAHLPSGIYYVRVTDSHEITKTMKLIISR